ncbi:hypothetical protein C0J52_23257 [Blattella germanica]|nr:hypothetical protein C0J52_23257 [Blattella germanica]
MTFWLRYVDNTSSHSTKVSIFKGVFNDMRQPFEVPTLFLMSQQMNNSSKPTADCINLGLPNLKSQDLIQKQNFDIMLVVTREWIVVGLSGTKLLIIDSNIFNQRVRQRNTSAVSRYNTYRSSFTLTLFRRYKFSFGLRLVGVDGLELEVPKTSYGALKACVVVQRHFVVHVLFPLVHVVGLLKEHFSNCSNIVHFSSFKDTNFDINIVSFPASYLPSGKKRWKVAMPLLFGISVAFRSENYHSYNTTLFQYHPLLFERVPGGSTSNDMDIGSLSENYATADTTSANDSRVLKLKLFHYGVLYTAIGYSSRILQKNAIFSEPCKEEINYIADNGSTRLVDILAYNPTTKEGIIVDPTIRFQMGSFQAEEVHQGQIWIRSTLALNARIYNANIKLQVLMGAVPVEDRQLFSQQLETVTCHCFVNSASFRHSSKVFVPFSEMR